MAGKKNSSAIEKLTPNAITIQVNGLAIKIPTDKAENAMMGVLLASQGRAFIQRSLKKWQDDEQWPSPKELKDIASAIREINESCNAVFAEIQIPVKPNEKAADKVDGVDDLDFDKLNQKAAPINVTPSDGQT